MTSSTASAEGGDGRTRTGRRQPLPDQLRGLALLGIVLVNMPFLAISSGGFNDESTEAPLDRAVAFLVVALAQGKFYLLFSFLFGYGLVLQLRGGRGLGPYRRRLVGLAVLGALHAVFFFPADILLTYAVLGSVLLAFAQRSERVVLAAAAVGGAIAVTFFVLLSRLPPAEAGSGFVQDPARLDRGLLGGFLDGAAARVEALPGALGALFALNAPFAFTMFLLGIVAARRRLLAEPEAHAALWRQLLWLGLVVGLPGGLASAWLTFGPDGGGQGDLVGIAIGFGTAPALTGAYVALAVRATRTRALAVVEPAGRMSLTGYLGESILMCAVFCGWGLGLLGRLTAWQAALVAIAVWVVLDVFSHLWLRRHRQGPLERLLRSWAQRGATTPPAARPGAPSGAPPAADPPPGRS